MAEPAAALPPPQPVRTRLQDIAAARISASAFFISGVPPRFDFAALCLERSAAVKVHVLQHIIISGTSSSGKPQNTQDGNIFSPSSVSSISAFCDFSCIFFRLSTSALHHLAPSPSIFLCFARTFPAHPACSSSSFSVCSVFLYIRLHIYNLLLPFSDIS